MNDVLVIGGGVIGLSIAYECASRGAKVTLVDRTTETAASWAGAGILPPTNEATALHPLEVLRGMSSSLHENWADRLQQETGIDNGFRKCGGVYVARSSGEYASLVGLLEEWNDFAIEFEELDRATLIEKVPSFRSLSGSQWPRKAVWAPGEYQIRNPHHLRALQTACEKLDVELVRTNDHPEISASGNRIEKVTVEGRDHVASNYCFCAGARTEELARTMGIHLPMVPVRGQMLLFKLSEPIFSPVIYEGSRYIVPRDDGHVLAGATIEEVGFDTSTSKEAIASLLNFASGWFADLNEDALVTAWAGLRPGTFDGFPYMGPLPEMDNAFVSTGHFKAGLHLSTGSAVVLANYLEGKAPGIEMTPFLPIRTSISGANSSAIT